ncbi:Specific RNA polymerase II transcription factor [Pleurostoma richardsiae]|uniref:Specific RNA polymerase II transcription factor n=1 Tax=Pleurostoma richardsiae TaxID=41990 RepID=A0AA38S4B1_9PEZI|nr:Specific RNA polymerase II transcription factor [Pleurostoma richardsiae]
MSSSRPFTCGQCSQTFTRNENLARHIRSRHGGEGRRPFRCCYCHTRFSRRDVCKRHVERCRTSLDSSREDDQESSDVPAPVPNVPGSPPSPPATSLSPDVAVASPMVNVNTVLSPQETQSWARPPRRAEQSSPKITKVLTHPEVHVSAYFEHFHPSLPLLHRPTFDESSPKTLRGIVVAIGNLYFARKLPDGDAASSVRWSHDLWNTGHEELAQLVGPDFQGLRTPWMLQAWLLYIAYGAYMGDGSQFDRAKEMLRSAVDAVRSIGLLRQAVARAGPSSGSTPADGDLLDNDDDPEDFDARRRWIAYVDEESMKLCLHVLFFLDFQIFSPCNIRPLTSPMELDWEVPLPASLWEADSPRTWLEKLEIETCVTGLQREDDGGLSYPCPGTKSLTLAMQSLMSNSPSPYLLAALAASPIAVLFLVTNIDAFVRDMTRSYYQLPPDLTDLSAFHILTQSQNRQVTTALGHIKGLVEGQDATAQDSAAERAIWLSVERVALAVKLALCRPDDLLISGIVEGSVAAGLATATHLTRGLYAGARRSLQSLLKPTGAGEDAVLVMLDELMGALASATHGDRREALREAPWTTVATYRILLALWRSLRWSAGEVREREAAAARQPQLQRTRRRFESSALVFNSIVEVVLQLGEQPGSARGLRTGWSAGLVAPPDLGEACFVKSVLQFWRDRTVWEIGSSMVRILEEVIAANALTVEVFGGGGSSGLADRACQPNLGVLGGGGGGGGGIGGGRPSSSISTSTPLSQSRPDAYHRL